MKKDTYLFLLITLYFDNYLISFTNGIHSLPMDPFRVQLSNQWNKGMVSQKDTPFCLLTAIWNERTHKTNQNALSCCHVEKKATYRDYRQRCLKTQSLQAVFQVVRHHHKGPLYLNFSSIRVPWNNEKIKEKSYKKEKNWSNSKSSRTTLNLVSGLIQSQMGRSVSLCFPGIKSNNFFLM